MKINWINQYLVCSSLAAIAALIFLCMECIIELILLIGMLLSSNKAFFNKARVVGIFQRLRTLLSSSSDRRSIGEKSELYGGQSSGMMSWLARKLRQTLAMWGRALPCCKISWRCCTKGSPTRRRTSSLYPTAIVFPAIAINCDFTPREMPILAKTDPPPPPTPPPPHTHTPPSKSSPLDNASVGEAFPTTSVNATSIALTNNTMHACDVPDIRVGAQIRASRNRFLTVSSEGGRLRVPTVVRAVSVAIGWRWSKCERQVALSWRHDVTCGRPDLCWLAQPVSLKRLTRQTRRTLYSWNYI